MYIHLYIKVSLIVTHECSRTAIQDTLKPWCLGSYAVASSTHIVHPWSLQTALRLSWLLSGCMICMPTRLASCIMSLALTLMQLA